METFIILIHSVSDVITNSSTELFLVKSICETLKGMFPEDMPVVNESKKFNYQEFKEFLSQDNPYKEDSKIDYNTLIFYDHLSEVIIDDIEDRYTSEKALERLKVSYLVSGSPSESLLELVWAEVKKELNNEVLEDLFGTDPDILEALKSMSDFLDLRPLIRNIDTKEFPPLKNMAPQIPCDIIPMSHLINSFYTLKDDSEMFTEIENYGADKFYDAVSLIIGKNNYHFARLSM